jgi:molybdopterin-guanine dinucleotide biosynthesis protein B
LIPPAESSPAAAKPLNPEDKAIAFVGPSGSGKTELICHLLAWFESQGYRVAILKHTHHKISLGDQGKDTWRYRQAGGRVVALAAPGLLQITRYFPADPPLAPVLAALTLEADLILVEGYKSSLLPKIAILDPQSANHFTEYPRLIGLVSPHPLASPLPVFQPHQVAELGAFLIQYLGWD